MTRFLAWATLANVTKAADLALKLAAVVAVLAVLSFFRGRGDVNPVADCWAPVRSDVDEVIAANLHLTPMEASVTVAALKQSARQPALPLGFGGDSMRIGCSRDIEAIESLRDPNLAQRLAALAPQQRALRIALLRRMYPDSGPGIVHYVPELAFQIAGDPTLTLKKLRRVLEFIEQSRTIRVFVRVTNTGKADALDVTIRPPKGFSLTQGHPLSFDLPPEPPEYQKLAQVGVQPVVNQSNPTEDLEPAESVYFIFESQGPRPPAVDFSDIVPEANTTPTVNVSRQFLILGLLLVIILVPLVIREIRNTPVDGTPPGRG
jgi:hypothetical protein